MLYRKHARPSSASTGIACGSVPCDRIHLFPGDGLIGAPLAYADNGDGTFTDIATGRQWEKKVVGSGTCTGALHDVDATCTWAEATGDWIAAINAEGGTGLGGQSDWQVPTAKELQSLIGLQSFHSSS